MWQEPSSSWERQRRWGWRFPNTDQWLGIATVCALNKHSSGFIHLKKINLCLTCQPTALKELALALGFVGESEDETKEWPKGH